MLIESIKNIFFDLRDYINSSEFLEQSREKKKYFVRKRLLPFVRVILFIINFRVNSTQAELNQFFEHVYSSENHPTKGAFFKLDLPKKKVKVRLIKIKLADGSIEVLATSLLNKKKYRKSFFKKLYFERWSIEGLIDILKNKLQMEYFSGKTVKVILQDFYAKLLQKNLYTFVNIEAEQEIKEEKQNLKHEYTTNENIGYSILKNKVIKIFIESIDKIFEILRKIIKSIKRQTEPIRPDRKYPRIKKMPGKSSTISYAMRTAF